MLVQEDTNSIWYSHAMKDVLFLCAHISKVHAQKAASQTACEYYRE